MSGLSTEKRRHPRYEFRTTVWFDQGEGMEPLSLTTVNVSAGGILLATERLTKLGDTVKLKLDLPFITEPIKAVGRVVRISEGIGEAKLVGLELIAVEGLTEGQFLRFLADLLG